MKKKKRLFSRSQYLFILILLICLGCYSDHSSVSNDYKTRPKNIPESAIWVGGADGGVYVLVSEVSKNRNVYFGKVFHENGNVWYKGRLILSPKNSSPPGNLIDENLYTGWDGDTLYLKNGSVLKTIKGN